MPKNTKTLPLTFATFSPHGCSSVASSFARAYLSSCAFAALTVVTLDLRSEIAVEDGRGAQLAVGHSGIARDLGRARPAELRVERVGFAPADRVEHEERASLGKSDALDLAHQRGRDPTSPGGAVHEHLRDLGAVARVRQLGQAQLRRADHAPIQTRRDDEHVPVDDVALDAHPPRRRILWRERQKEAD